MPLEMENDARRAAVERLGNADRLWTDVAMPYGNRVSLTVPADLCGRSVQVFFTSVREQGADETADVPKDGFSRLLAALPEQCAAGNWNGYGERPLNKDGRPALLADMPHHAELVGWPQGDDEGVKLQRIDCGGWYVLEVNQ